MATDSDFRVRAATTATLSPGAPTQTERRPEELSQYELLRLIMSRAIEAPAAFADAHRIVSRGRLDEGRTLTRELLSDLTIRDWIVFVRIDGSGEPVVLSRTRHEIELASERNWDDSDELPQVRYALTEKGRQRAVTMRRG